MELLLNKNVIRPDISGLMGAYGIALLAIERQQEKIFYFNQRRINRFPYGNKNLPLSWLW